MCVRHTTKRRRRHPGWNDAAAVELAESRFRKLGFVMARRIPDFSSISHATPRLFFTSALCVFMCACAARDAEIAGRARSELIGLSDNDLRMCAGHPANEDKVPGGVIWMYEHGAASSDGLTITPVIPVVGAQIGQPDGGYCRTQLKLVGGKVTEVSFAGATDLWGGRDAVCAPIVRNCLDYRKGRR